MLPKIEVQTLNYKLDRKLNVEKFLSLDTKLSSITNTYNEFIALQLHIACIPTYSEKVDLSCFKKCSEQKKSFFLVYDVTNAACLKFLSFQLIF